MRICPTCNSKYTDLTLKFCLQDGAALVAGTDKETEVYDADSFSNHETVAVSEGGPSLTDVSSETVVHDRRALPGSPKGIGFLSGVVAGGLILALFVAVFLGFWFIPGMITGDTNSNVDAKGPKSYKVTAESVEAITASSTRKGEKGNLYIPENILDSDVRTAWGEGVRGTGKGEWVKIEFGEKIDLREVEIKPGYFKNASIWKKNNRVSSVQLQFSDGKFRLFDFPDEMKTQKMEFEGVETSFVKVTIRDIYMGSADQEDTLISEIGFSAVK